MQEFVDSLKKGEFHCPYTSCKAKAWPPSYYCSQCLSKTSLQIIETTGTLLYFTTSYLKGMEGCYGLVEMAGIKLIGSFDTFELKDGLQVKMAGWA